MDLKSERKIRENVKKLDLNAGFHKYNCVRLSKTESKSHADAKYEKAWELCQLGHPFVTEAKSKDRKREFDVIDLLTGEVFEYEKSKRITKKDCTTVRI